MRLTKETVDRYNTYNEALFMNLYSYAIRNNRTIKFSSLDLKDKEHLLFLSTAQQLSGLYNFKIQANIPFIKKLLNKKYRKIKRLEDTKEGLVIEDYISFMCSSLKFPRAAVKDIYNVYYENLT